MKIQPRGIDGAWEVTPILREDPRGLFLEWYRFDELADAIGYPMRLAQANISVSARGVVRGIHFADVPPGQAKYVTCTQGAVVDVIVDIRVGSPTFGRCEAIRLDEVERRAMYIAEGLGHGFCALTDNATLTYLCAQTYRPGHEHSVHPLDPELGIDWPTGTPVLSARDEAAPTLAQAQAQGLLPSYEACLAYYAELRRRQPR